MREAHGLCSEHRSERCTCQVEAVAALLQLQQHRLQVGLAALHWLAKVLDGLLQRLPGLGAHAGHMVGVQRMLQQLQHLHPGGEDQHLRLRVPNEPQHSPHHSFHLHVTCTHQKSHSMHCIPQNHHPHNQPGACTGLKQLLVQFRVLLTVYALLQSLAMTGGSLAAADIAC